MPQKFEKLVSGGILLLHLVPFRDELELCQKAKQILKTHQFEEIKLVNRQVSAGVSQDKLM